MGGPDSDVLIRTALGLSVCLFLFPSFIHILITACGYKIYFYLLMNI